MKRAARLALARIGTFVFGPGALAAGLVSLADILAHGRLTYLSPSILAAFVLLGIGVLFMGLLRARDKARMLQATDRRIAHADRTSSNPRLRRFRQ